MMLFSTTRRHPVIASDTAKTLGRITGMQVVEGPARVVAFSVHTRRGTRLLPWTQVHACGPDAVMSKPDTALREPDDTAPAGVSLIGKVVLTEEGHQLGHINDAAFAPDTGLLDWLTTAGYQVPGPQIVSVGPFAVVVTEPAPTTKTTGRARHGTARPANGEPS
ncbi:hypothetical protein OHV05_14725 [Kitasatospora sp. NBC_00070]|uniref:PRC-barrel domain-containing protein n=1 Tax=Kitasatospora sp. NBC_00070 TaxID=2975962 RepID=UPI0032489C37